MERQSAELQTSLGFPTYGIFGFVRTLQSTIKYDRPETVVAIWDGGLSDRRRTVYPGYKSRKDVEPDDEALDYLKVFSAQRQFLDPLLTALGIPQIRLKGREADDIIYRITRGPYNEWQIMTEDRDLLQAVAQNVRIWRPIANDRKPGTGLITHENFKESVGFSPGYYQFYRALVGKGDEVPGVKGIGDVTAVALINQMTEPTLENLKHQFEQSKLKRVQSALNDWVTVERNLELADLSRESFAQEELVQILELLQSRTYFNERMVSDYFNQLEFRSILNQFDSWTMPFKHLKAL
jgi:DNA polymerase-1